MRVWLCGLQLGPAPPSGAHCHPETRRGLGVASVEPLTPGGSAPSAKRGRTSQAAPHKEESCGARRGGGLHSKFVPCRRVPGRRPRTAAEGLQSSWRNGIPGAGARPALEALPQAGEELVLRAVAVGLHCLQELSGIRRGRTGSRFHWDSPRVPAAAVAVASLPLSFQDLPLSFLPLSVS